MQGTRDDRVPSGRTHSIAVSMAARMPPDTSGRVPPVIGPVTRGAPDRLEVARGGVAPDPFDQEIARGKCDDDGRRADELQPACMLVIEQNNVPTDRDHCDDEN